jgi:hypothetical protein
MKAKVIKTGETVHVYHEPQHGQTNIYKESVLVNGRMWTEDELDFCAKTSEAPQQYIKKSALVTEIKSKRKCAQTLCDNAINSSMQQFYGGMKQGCVDILSFLDTLEVKEADLNLEITLWANAIPEIRLDDVERLATYFFELGLKAQKGE